MLATALALGLGLGLVSASPLESRAGAAVYQPPVGETFDYSLGYSVTTSNAKPGVKIYFTDLEDTSAATITALKNAGHTVVCYFSAGSVEDYRDDADQFPAVAVGGTLEGWPDEKWLDTRNSGVRQIMTNRIASAATKGCQGVDPDNVDGFDNESGFDDMTEADGVNYIRFLAAAAHAKGLAFGLKNVPGLASQVVDVSEWAVNEECVRWNECKQYASFIKAGKPVFHVEYTSSDKATSVSDADKKKFCAAGGQSGFTTIIKHLSLDNFTVTC